MKSLSTVLAFSTVLANQVQYILKNKDLVSHVTELSRKKFGKFVFLFCPQNTSQQVR